nr:vacuolar protein sorting-associated protein 32 like 1 [Quercus suber]
MAVRQRQRASLGIKSDLGKVTTYAPEVGEDLEMVDDDGGDLTSPTIGRLVETQLDAAIDFSSMYVAAVCSDSRGDSIGVVKAIEASEAAIQCWKRKRLYEQQIEQLGNFQLRIQDQMILLEGAKATIETVDALRTGAAARKAMQKATYVLVLNLGLGPNTYVDEYLWTF